ncbi:MAG: hypothetical protein CME36_09735 [unclassified Hahellaceae]|nr:hypothetical protein [Hahellaceae bacterium]|tara:strand:- start:28644 stop:33113 length:4470 start_codon:yes stop_codon:yes gene_type:complete
MRVDSGSFKAAWGREVIEPRFVLRLTFSADDVVYFTSHKIPDIETSFQSTIQVSSATSQEISPDKGRASIGSISFSVLDKQVTEALRSRLADEVGIRMRDVEFFVGSKDIPFTSYSLATTQQVDGISFKEGVYTIRCADVQRQMKKDIFTKVQTSLRQSVVANAPVIEGYDTSKFLMVYQPPELQSDAPGQRVGYLKMNNGVVVRYSGKTANSFTGCVWGVLDTRHLIEDIVLPEDVDQESAPKIEEFVYMEMPAVMMAYSILTGFIYGTAAEKLPPHWSLGISPRYIRTSSFVGIGTDWFNPDNFSQGVYAVIRGHKSTDGKKFIEEQIMQMLGAFMPIHSNGELGLRRLAVVHSSGSYVRELSHYNIVDIGELEHDLSAVINLIRIQWNYVDDKPTRVNVLDDQRSLKIHKEAEPLDLELRTLHSSRHSYSVIRSRFDSLRDRYAGPPLRISVTLTPDQNDLEVGDIVRLRTNLIPDFTGPSTLDRNFEIQQVVTNWSTGEVTLKLFGSSQPADALPPEQYGGPLSDAWYSSEGRNIVTLLGNAIAKVGDVYQIVRNTTITGGEKIDDANSIVYCPGDLTIRSGVSVIMRNNIQLRVKGFFQNNGLIVSRSISSPTVVTQALPLRFLGQTQATDGVIINIGTSTITREFSGRTRSQTIVGRKIITGNNRQLTTGTTNDAAPPLSLEVTGDGRLVGLVGDMRGSDGPIGGAAEVYTNGTRTAYQPGRDGGNGGGALVVISRGAAIGPSGAVNTSGEHGKAAEPLTGIQGLEYGPGQLQPGSSGGGAPGPVYYIMDGIGVNAPFLTQQNSIAQYGACPVPRIGRWTVNEESNIEHSFAVALSFHPRVPEQYGPVGSLNLGSYIGSVREYDNGALRGVQTEFSPNTFSVNHRVQYLAGSFDTGLDTGFSKPGLQVVLTEATNTPPSPLGNISTIEYSVVPPADKRYLYSKIEYRVKGSGRAFIEAPPAAPESFVRVVSDGTTYEFRAYPVSVSREVSKDFISGEIKTTDISIPVNRDNVLPLARPVISLKGGGTTFDGTDAHFTWVDDNNERQHFDYYYVEVLHGATVVRDEQIRSNSYSYTGQMNFEDGLSRTFTLRVTAVGLQLQESVVGSLTVTNPAPTQPDGLSITGGFNSIKIHHEPFTDPDYLETHIYYSSSPTFSTSGPGHQVITQPSHQIIDLQNDTTYYVKLAFHDAFGRGAITGSFQVKTIRQFSGASAWAFVDQADRDFINLHLTDNAIPSTKIEKLVASKIVTGILASTETITCEGIIEAIGYNGDVRMGPRQIGATLYMLSVMTAGQLRFGVAFNGDIIIGNPAGGQGIRWVQASGLLQIEGDITANKVTARSIVAESIATKQVNSFFPGSIDGLYSSNDFGFSGYTEIYNSPVVNDTPYNLTSALNMSIEVGIAGQVNANDDTIDLQIHYNGTQMMFMAGPRVGDRVASKAKTQIIVVPPGTTYVRVYARQNDATINRTYDIEVDYYVHLAKDTRV